MSMSTVLSEMSTVTTQLRADIRSFQTAAYRPPQKLLDLLNNFKGARDAVMRGGADSMPWRRRSAASHARIVRSIRRSSAGRRRAVSYTHLTLPTKRIV